VSLARIARAGVKLLLAASLLAFVIYAFLPRPVGVEVAVVTRGTLRVTLSQEGRTRVRDRFVISAPVAGRLLRIELDPGDPVRSGETVVAEIVPAEPLPLDARAWAEARARVAVAKAELERAKAQREMAAAAARFANRQRERILRLAEEEAVSEEDRDRAIAEARKADEALRAAEAAVKAALGALEQANAALIEPGGPKKLRTESTGRGVVRIRSPVSGVVLKKYRESEAVVQAGERLLEVGDPSDLEVIADFLSTDAVRIRPGMPVLLKRWGGLRTLKGRVRRVEPSAFTKISALGVEEQRVWVIVDFTDPPAARSILGDGYRVEVQVVVWEKEDALTVPVGAIFRHNGTWAAFRVERRRAELTLLRIGRRNDRRAEVLAGLKEGDVVIVYPPEKLRDGTAVYVKPRELPSSGGKRS